MFISFSQFIKGNSSVAWVIHIWAETGCFIGRPNSSCHKSRFVWSFSGIIITGFSGKLCRFIVELINEIRHMIVRHRDGRAGKSIGLYNVCPSLQILPVDFIYHAGFGDGQHIIIPFHGICPITKLLAAIVFFGKIILLNHGSHSSIQNQNPMLQCII